MPIKFDSATQAFAISSAKFSYLLQVLPSGHLAHVYWGAPIEATSIPHALVTNLDRAFSPVPDVERRGFSLDTLPQELPSYGNSDFRSSAVQVQRTDGSTVSNLRYKEHRIFAGKPGLEGLPATYVEDDSEATTLEIDLYDDLSGLTATLSYSVFESVGALTRSVRLTNGGTESLNLDRVLSASVDFRSDDYEFLHLTGAWARERDLYRTPLRPGGQWVESRRGASGHDHNPFFALVSKGAGENHGEAYGFNLVYSGSFIAGAEVAQYLTTRAQVGINPFDFNWLLEPGESFQAPEAVLVYSASGLGEMSRTFHQLYRTRLVRGQWRDRERPVLINSWEASYFKIDEATIMKLARTAAKAGIELLVMDDGWFGHRDNDHTSLGDWYVHPEKFPNGLEPLARQINDLGMTFGLWFEPEMVSPDSDLYRAHPDWCLHVPGRSRTQARQQLILDLSRTDVQDAIIQMVGDILSTVPIAYVKWDMNRNMTEIGSALLPPERQRETAHRYMLGLYRVLETITARFPEVLFESCSGGGGRFDPGILYYMPQTWTSDNTDAISRLNIQHGTSFAYPAASMGAHVSASPNHQVGRETSLEIRGAVALAGNFGYEMDLNELSEQELEIVAQQVALCKEVRGLVQTGDFYRLKSPFEGNETAWMFVSSNQREALAIHVKVLSRANAPLSWLKFQGLDAGLQYEVTPVLPASEPIIIGGDVLMNVGLRTNHGGHDFDAHVWRLKAV